MQYFGQLPQHRGIHARFPGAQSGLVVSRQELPVLLWKLAPLGPKRGMPLHEFTQFLGELGDVVRHVQAESIFRTFWPVPKAVPKLALRVFWANEQDGFLAVRGTRPQNQNARGFIKSCQVHHVRTRSVLMLHVIVSNVSRRRVNNGHGVAP